NIQPGAWPAWLTELMRQRNIALVIALVALVIIALASGAWIVCGVLAAAVVAGQRWLAAQADRIDTVAVLTDPVKAQAAIAATPPRPDFNIRLEGETTAPVPTPGPQPGADSVEAANFRAAALEINQRLAIRLPDPPPLLEYDMNTGAAKVARSIDPRV